MPQFIRVSVITIVAGIAGLCVENSFRWRDRVRPPVSLQAALKIGEELLGDEAKNRWCVDVSISGNPHGAERPGAWHLLFAAADGSKKQVYVDMDGNGKLSPWNEAIDWKKDKGRRTDLNDAFLRLKDLFKKENLGSEIAMEGNRLVGRYKTRSYHVYPSNPDGSFTDDLAVEVGPKHDGIIFEAQTVSDGNERGDYQIRPYWLEDTRSYPTTQERKFILVKMRYGREFPKEIKAQMEQAFGIDFITP